MPEPSSKPGFFESVTSSWQTTTGKVVIVANLVPAVGLLALNWDAYSVAILYWIENIVIGGFQVLKMLMADGSAAIPLRRGLGASGSAVQAPASIQVSGALSKSLKIVLIPFFIFHYGMFCWGHGTFIVALLGKGRSGGASANLPPNIGFAVLALVGLHVFLFVKEYIMEHEWQSASPITLMLEPYGRIVVLHVAILFGGFAVAAFGMSPNVLLALILFKTTWDCRADARRRWAPGTAPLQPA